MNSATLFGLLAVLFFLFVLAVFLIVNKISPIKYFSTGTGKGIAKGIVMVVSAVVVVAVVFGLSGCTGRYFNDASVYVGLDYTKKDSPMCESGPDAHTTSNLGVRGNMWRSDDDRLSVDGKITHHSCVFNEDRYSYDAAGIEFDYKIWER